MIKGARLVGNEFTLISGRAYLNKEHYERRLRELDGFADLDIQAGVPSMAGGGGALVPIMATWTFRGQPFSLERTLRKSADGSVDDRRIPVRINNGQGADAAVGKATRKLLAQIHRRLTGSDMSEDDQEDLETIDGEVIDNVVAQEAPAKNPRQPTSTQSTRATAAASTTAIFSRNIAPNSKRPSKLVRSSNVAKRWPGRRAKVSCRTTFEGKSNKCVWTR